MNNDFLPNHKMKSLPMWNNQKYNNLLTVAIFTIISFDEIAPATEKKLLYPGSWYELEG